MPRFVSASNYGGGAYSDQRPLSGWQYEYLPWPAIVKILAASSGAVGVTTMAVNSGSEQIQRAGQVPAGFTAGVLPTSFNVEPLIFHAPAGDRLEIVLAATGASYVNLVVDVNPA